jgi:hypothetical protein
VEDAEGWGRYTGPEFFFVQTVFLRLAWKMRKGRDRVLSVFF